MSALRDWTLINANTGLVKWGYPSLTEEDALAQVIEPEDVLIAGTWAQADWQFVRSLDGWSAQPRAKSAPTVWAIKLEAQRRIEDRFPIWRQINLQRESPVEWVAATSYIDAVRSASNAIEAMSPIPQDFASDVYWPVING